MVRLFICILATAFISRAFSLGEEPKERKVVLNLQLLPGSSQLKELENAHVVFEWSPDQGITNPDQISLYAAVDAFASKYGLTREGRYNLQSKASKMAREIGFVPYSEITARLSPTAAIQADIYDWETPDEAAARVREKYGLSIQDAEYIRVMFDMQKRSAFMPSIQLDVVLPSFAAALDSVATAATREDERGFLLDSSASAFSLDKTSDHLYEYPYGKYLYPLRNKPIKMLEIGLGCNMGDAFVLGASSFFWRKYYPLMDLYVAEFDEDCVDRWEAANPMSGVRLLRGDQSRPEDLRRWMEAAGGRGSLDVIIDDGGHSNKQQLTSLVVLFNEALRPGGVYILEDMQVSYRMGWSDFGTNHTSKVVMSIIESHILGADVLGERRPKDVVEAAAPWTLHGLKSVDCFPEACVFVKCGAADRCAQHWPQRLYTHS